MFGKHYEKSCNCHFLRKYKGNEQQILEFCKFWRIKYTAKHGYTEHAYNESTLAVKGFSFHVTILYVVNLTDITNYAYTEAKSPAPWPFLITVFYCIVLECLDIHGMTLYSETYTFRNGQSVEICAIRLHTVQWFASLLWWTFVIYWESKLLGCKKYPKNLHFTFELTFFFSLTTIRSTLTVFWENIEYVSLPNRTKALLSAVHWAIFGFSGCTYNQYNPQPCTSHI